MKTLQTLFLDELADMYDAETRLTKALPKMAKAASNDELREAIESHLEETEGHVNTVKEVFSAFGQKPKSKKCEAMTGLLEEGEHLASENKGSPTIDAAIISAAQKVEHYEIASYGTLREWARLLGNEEAADSLQEILEQEEAANQTLTELATSRCNEEALGEEQAGESEEGELVEHERGAASRRSSRGQ